MKPVCRILVLIAALSLILGQTSCRNPEVPSNEAQMTSKTGMGTEISPQTEEAEEPEEIATEPEEIKPEKNEDNVPAKRRGRRSLYETQQITMLKKQMTAAEERAYKKCQDNDEIKAIYEKAKDLLRDEDEEKAQENIEKIIETCPEFAPAWFFKARILKNSEKYDEALAAYDRAIESDPKFIHPRFNKGRLLMFLYKNKEAIETMLPILDVSDELLDVHYSLAKAYAEDRETFYESLLHYYRCRELDPGNALMPVINKEISELELALKMESTVKEEDLKEPNPETDGDKGSSDKENE